MKKIFFIIVCILSLCGCTTNNNGSVFYENYEAKETQLNNLFSLTKDYVISEFLVSDSIQKYNKLNRYEVDPIVNDTIINDAKTILYLGQRNWSAKQMLYRIVAIEFNQEESTKIVKDNNPWDLNYIDGNIVYQNSYVYYIMRGKTMTEGLFLFSDDGKTLLTCTINAVNLVLPNVETIGQIAFMARTSVEKVKLHENTKIISWGAFSGCWRLQELELNNNLSVIETMAFYGCQSLKNIVIPKSVITVGNQIFDNGTMYCEAKSKPIGWSDNFYGSNTKVYWGNQWHYDENGKPIVNDNI